MHTALLGSFVETVVIAFGGSILAPGQVDAKHIQTLAAMLKDLGARCRLFLVVGGGKTARVPIQAGRDAGCDEEMLDRIGIAATRLNAQTLIGFLAAADADVNRDVPITTRDAVAAGTQITVMGGTTPGHSTDYVGAELAREAGAARLVIATNVDGVYTADPRADRSAHLIDAMTFDELQAITGTQWTQAGMAGVVDGPATVLLSQARLETRVVNGNDLDNVAAAAQGGSFKGTLVTEGT